MVPSPQLNGGCFSLWNWLCEFHQVSDWSRVIFYILLPRLSSWLENQLVKFVTLHIVFAWFIPESEEYRIKIFRNQWCVWFILQVYWYSCQQALIKVFMSTIFKPWSGFFKNEGSCSGFADLLGLLQKRRHVCWICTNPTSLFPPLPIIDAAKVQISEKGGRGGLTLWPNARSSGS